MQACNTSAIKKDMTLAKSVYDLQGVMLLKKGHRLTAKNILMLKSWGVPQVWIDAQRDTDPDDLSERQKNLKKEHQTPIGPPIFRRRPITRNGRNQTGGRRDPFY